MLFEDLQIRLSSPEACYPVSLVLGVSPPHPIEDERTMFAVQLIGSARAAPTYNSYFTGSSGHCTYFSSVSENGIAELEELVHPGQNISHKAVLWG